MAPEQIRGEDIDARTDVYALGAILFEILTLEPLQGHGPVVAILERALNGVDARASVRAPHRDVAPELELSCVRATARDRTERTASARELADAVEAYLSGDRDFELRQELARDHLARAEAAVARSAEPSVDTQHRSDALREVGRAIALAPNDANALALLVRLLTEPPKVAPPEVTEIVEREARASRREMMPKVALAYSMTCLVSLAFEIPLGIRSTALVLVPVALWLLAGAAGWAAYRYEVSKKGAHPYVTVLASIALAATSVIHGPLIVIPAIAAVHAMGMALTTQRSNRAAATVLYGLGITVPTLLAWFGVHPVRHEFRDGLLTIAPGRALSSARRYVRVPAFRAPRDHRRRRTVRLVLPRRPHGRAAPQRAPGVAASPARAGGGRARARLRLARQKVSC